jgi:hypothetical protein
LGKVKTTYRFHRLVFDRGDNSYMYEDSSYMYDRGDSSYKYDRGDSSYMYDRGDSSYMYDRGDSRYMYEDIIYMYDCFNYTTCNYIWVVAAGFSRIAYEGKRIVSLLTLTSSGKNVNAVSLHLSSFHNFILYESIYFQ